MNTWNSGGAAFWRTWQSAYSLTHRGGPGIEERVGFTSIPGGQSERVGTLGGMALGVSRSSTHPQESMNLIRFLVRRELQSKKDSANAKPPGQPVFYELPLMLDPYAHSATTNQQRGGVVARPSNIVGARYEDFANSYFEAVHSVLTGEKKSTGSCRSIGKTTRRNDWIQDRPTLTGSTAFPMKARGNRSRTSRNSRFFERQR